MLETKNQLKDILKYKYMSYKLNVKRYQLNNSFEKKAQPFIESAKKLGYTVNREGDEFIASPPGTPGYVKPKKIDMVNSIGKGLKKMGKKVSKLLNNGYSVTN